MMKHKCKVLGKTFFLETEEEAQELRALTTKLEQTVKVQFEVGKRTTNDLLERNENLMINLMVKLEWRDQAIIALSVMLLFSLTLNLLSL